MLKAIGGDSSARLNVAYKLYCGYAIEVGFLEY